MKRTASIIILALFASSAFAIGLGNDNINAASASQGQNQGQAQGQIQGQAQGQGQAQLSNSNADSRSRALASVNAAPVTTVTSNQAPTTLTVNEAAIPANTRNEQVGTVNVRTVPNVYGGNVYPTAPCMGSSTVGAAALGWGASVGTSWADHECGKRETARSFQNLGLTSDAVAVLCTSEYAAAAPACAKPK